MNGEQTLLVTPCEVAVKKYVPSIRASIAIVLVRDYGLSIYKAAKLLRLTPAAISNYLLRRRGSDYIDTILNDEQLYQHIFKLAERVVSGNIDNREISNEMCNLCRELRKRVEKLGSASTCPANH
ncbi:transcriptional regulator [Hyperthermus butylicus]|uniref:Universally conserved protein n=1 Tax=Hyperthermus butylicus (strain DSM 5456 / JCM 9403 / PLM1-5) TaxID=415426 RepID=A2BLB2_HYPBU|nr:hypothetical protein [Hyperthermus butylicus]ABM80773.1 universally conserved protein [Hyperthermus butylicus DSM 5456]